MSARADSTDGPGRQRGPGGYLTGFRDQLGAGSRWVSGIGRVARKASPETAAVARKATSKDVASVRAPATSGPRKAPASEAIWKAATGVPPRPPMTSPTTAAEDTPSRAEPAPYRAIPARNRGAPPAIAMMTPAASRKAAP